MKSIQQTVCYAGKIIKKIPGGNQICQFINGVRYKYYLHKNMDERKVSGGKYNPDKFFYIVRPPENATAGLMSIHNYVLQRIEYAVIHG